MAREMLILTRWLLLKVSNNPKFLWNLVSSLCLSVKRRKRMSSRSGMWC